MSALLVLGLFLPPLTLLALGHRWTRRSRRARRLFWGMLGGHTFAWIPTLVAALWPPVVWTEAARSWWVHGSLLTGALVGLLCGALYHRLRAG